MLKYPIGIQSFDRIIEDGYVYVDKTDLVYSLVKEGTIYFLSHPRCFGKSLLLSTLKNGFLTMVASDYLRPKSSVNAWVQDTVSFSSETGTVEDWEAVS